MKFDLSPYNKQQVRAITHGNGPLLVISGAGTGKTHVLTGRILHLILEKGTAPEEILALTFTEKAAQEMAGRVDAALPLGSAEVWIKTYHAFCDNVLRERGHEIGLSTDFKLLNEVDLWMFLKRHLLDFDLKYYRSLGNPQKFLHSMQAHFSRLQDENIAPEQYLKYTKDTQKKAKTDEDKENAEKQLELANAYGIYTKLLLENNYMDFGGLMAYALQLFEKRKSVLAEYQKRFRYILVDEFQDTNFAQNKIVMMLASAHKNLFVVGDDDQSIYKWRGASLTNIQYFHKEFPRAKSIVLNENYRSNQAILDCAYSAIQKNNPNRLEITENVNKKLRAVSGRKVQIPEVHHFAALEEETEFVVNKAVASLMRGKNTAILVRTNALAIPFLDKLKHKKLPFQHFSESLLFTKPGIKDCMALLRVLADPRDDLALFRFLQLPFLEISMDALLKIVKKAKFQTSSIFETMEGAKFETIKNDLLKLVEYSRTRPVSEVLRRFLKESSYLKYLEKKGGEGLDDIAAFSEKIAEFEERNEHKSVSDFLTYAQLLEEIGRQPYETPVLDPNAIKVLTIHAAKGLEFDAVFVPGLVKSKFPSMSRSDAFEIPTELIPEILPEGDHHIEEERRLFYVALTRACESLMLSYSDFYDGKKQWKVSPFINEILESGKAISKTPVKNLKKSRATTQQEELPIISSRKHRTIKLEIPKLSFSQLDAFKTCPLKYQFRYIFNLPAPAPAMLNFGTGMHNTLRDFYIELQANPTKRSCDKASTELLEKLYKKNWIPYGYDSRDLQESQKKLGLEILKKFYEHEKTLGLIIPEFIEKQFVVKINEVILSGRIDRIDRLPDGTYEVIDYKTGSAKQKNLKNDPQLSIYALACRDVFKIPVSRLSLYYIENLKKVSTTRTDAQIDACKEEIIKSARQISDSEFSPTPGYHCSYCDFRTICPAAKSVSVT